jgi:hypothetical protein
MPKEMKGTSSTPPRRTSSSDRSLRRPWENPWLRGVASLALVAHLVAVTVAPFAILTNEFGPRIITPGPVPLTEQAESLSTPPNRPLPVILKLAEALQPYLDPLYLNHGYSFFAPEPSASYVIDYEIEKENGEKVRGRLPDLGRHWPRLLYHRYFMLASQNYDLTERARSKTPADSTATLNYAIAKHLLESEGGKRAVLRLLIHRLLWPEDVRQGKSLDVEETYVVVGEITYPPPGDLGAAGGEAVTIAEEEKP